MAKRILREKFFNGNTILHGGSEGGSIIESNGRPKIFQKCLDIKIQKFESTEINGSGLESHNALSKNKNICDKQIAGIVSSAEFLEYAGFQLNGLPGAPLYLPFTPYSHPNGSTLVSSVIYVHNHDNSCYCELIPSKVSAASVNKMVLHEIKPESLCQAIDADLSEFLAAIGRNMDISVPTCWQRATEAQRWIYFHLFLWLNVLPGSEEEFAFLNKSFIKRTKEIKNNEFVEDEDHVQFNAIELTKSPKKLFCPRRLRRFPLRPRYIIVPAVRHEFSDNAEVTESYNKIAKSNLFRKFASRIGKEKEYIVHNMIFSPLPDKMIGPLQLRIYRRMWRWLKLPASRRTNVFVDEIPLSDNMQNSQLTTSIFNKKRLESTEDFLEYLENGINLKCDEYRDCRFKNFEEVPQNSSSHNQLISTSVNKQNNLQNLANRLLKFLTQHNLKKSDFAVNVLGLSRYSNVLDKPTKWKNVRSNNSSPNILDLIKKWLSLSEEDRLAMVMGRMSNTFFEQRKQSVNKSGIASKKLKHNPIKENGIRSNSLNSKRKDGDDQSTRSCESTNNPWRSDIFKTLNETENNSITKTKTEENINNTNKFTEKISVADFESISSFPNQKIPTENNGHRTKCGGGEMKQYRARFSQNQLAYLKFCFQTNARPSTEAKMKIAKETGLSLKTVMIFFSNRRRRGINGSRSFSTKSQILENIPFSENENKVRGTIVEPANRVCNWNMSSLQPSTFISLQMHK